jgi:hypothetical protein
MKIDAAGALTLAAVIEQDLRAVNRLESHALSLPVDSLQRAQLDSLGFALHNIYNALENSFTQISLSFENHVRDRVRWHRELLDKMFLDLPPLRSAVLTGDARPVLNDLLGFRHLFRHAYEFTLDAAKTVALSRRWQAEGGAVKNSLAAFAIQLRAVATADL